MKKEIMNFVYKNYGRTGLIVQKHSPEILITTGVIGVITSTVFACKATLKAGDILVEHEKKLALIDQAIELDADYKEKDSGKDVTIAIVQTGVAFVKLYGPSVTLGLLSLGCILSAHNIMRKRNLALMLAYKTIEDMYANYRNRVVADYGEDTDYMYHNGLKRETIEVSELQANGKDKMVKKEVVVKDDTNQHSIYSRFFDESCKNWDKLPEYNLMFLKGQQSYFNDMLRVRGHVFLNEVYDALGLERTAAGALVGWVAGDGHDNYVDFGLYDPTSRRFINNLEPVILLDFNVDGVIYDQI